jgi:hypothetical protein
MKGMWIQHFFICTLQMNSILQMDFYTGHWLHLLVSDICTVEVEDDGIGRKRAMEITQRIDKDHTSLSTAITRERIHVLNKKLKTKISLDILDLKNDKGEPVGTRVVFEIPVALR